MPIHVAINSYNEPADNWHRVLASIEDIADTLTVIEGKYPLHPPQPDTQIPHEYYATPTTIISLEADEVTKRNAAYHHTRNHTGYLLWLDADEELHISNKEAVQNATSHHTADAITVNLHTVDGPATARFNQWENPGTTSVRPRLFSLAGHLQCGPAHYHHTITHGDQAYNLWPIAASRKLQLPNATTASLTSAITIHHHTLHRTKQRIKAKHEYTHNRNQAGIEK